MLLKGELVFAEMRPCSVGQNRHSGAIGCTDSQCRLIDLFPLVCPSTMNFNNEEANNDKAVFKSGTYV
ncbi:hypothetical protein R0K17_24015, partial [Planococcus sp. SIMBA_143]